MLVKVILFVFLLGAYSLLKLDEEGPLNLILNTNLILNCNHSRDLDLDVSLIKIYFYDFSNNVNRTLFINDAAQAILGYKNLDKNRKFVMYVVGLNAHVRNKHQDQIRHAYKYYSNSYLIMPEHYNYTNLEVNAKKGFERAVQYTYYIGKAMGNMLTDLNAGGIDSRNIHCVGHSLGAQMLLHTGQTFLKRTGKMIPKITALDPAGPCFSNAPTDDQIRAGVADYVEIYHCNSGELGTTKYFGDADFIVNDDGEFQPGCSYPFVPEFFDTFTTAACNHRACINIWTATIKKPNIFPAYRCNSYKDFDHKKCLNNERTFAGAGNPGVKGFFYFTTKI